MSSPTTSAAASPVLPDEKGFFPNGWEDPNSHKDLAGPCTNPCCFPEVNWYCQGPADGKYCGVKIRHAGTCINCEPPR